MQGEHDNFDQALAGSDPDRRSFLKKLAVGTAFAAPAVSSFTMTGIQAAYAQTPTVSGSEVEGGSSTTSTTAPNQTSSTTSTTQPNQPPPD
jgi:hypothetical protein